MTALDLHDVSEFPPFSPSIGEYAVLMLGRREWRFPFARFEEISDAPDREALREGLTYALLAAGGIADDPYSRDVVPAFTWAASQRYRARLIELKDLAEIQVAVRAEMRAFDREVERVMREQNVSRATARWAAHASAEVARRVAERKAVA